MIHQPMSYGSGYSRASDMELDTKEISLKKELYEIISVQGKT
jgi:ATP-dependent protease ClpP protease subunit